MGRFSVIDRETDEIIHLSGIIKVGVDPKAHIKTKCGCRMHAIIESYASGVTLVDLGGEPGTKLNGARISERRSLREKANEEA